MILFDNGTLKPIARVLTDHEITFARQIGWHELANRRADPGTGPKAPGYDVRLSTDKNIQYQQILSTQEDCVGGLGGTRNGLWFG